MSFVKCMVCGNKLKQINGNHLRTDNLTVAQYRELYPQASLVAPELAQEWAAALNKHNESRVFRRACRKCGTSYETRCSRKYYCDSCQSKRAYENLIRLWRKHHKLAKMRNKNTYGMNWKKAAHSLGTFGNRYLEVDTNGRIRGFDIVLNKGYSHNSHPYTGRFSNTYVCEECRSDKLIRVFKGKAYCIECEAAIIIARENEHYTIAELCCKNCGIVYNFGIA